MNYRKIWPIAKREFLQRVTSRGFLIATVALPLVMVGYVFLLRALMGGAAAQARLAIVDLSGAVGPKLAREMRAKRLPSGQPEFVVETPAVTAATAPAVRARLRREIAAGKDDGYLLLPAGILHGAHAEFHARNVANMRLRADVENAIQVAVMQTRLRRSGLGAAAVTAAMASVKTDTLRVGGGKDNGQTETVGFVLGMVLYAVLIIYGSMFMRSTTEEKNSRVAEVMLSSVDAFSMLVGKLLGVGATGLTQIGVWALALAAITTYGALLSGGFRSLRLLPHLHALTYLCMIGLFVLGFMVYGALYAACGALGSDDDQKNQYQIPITFLLVGSFLAAQPVMNHPNTLWSVVLSEIPYFSPVLMTIRTVVAHPPVWQVALAMVLSLLAMVGTIKLSAKIYRVGLLMTGKRPTLPELVRWLRVA